MTSLEYISTRIKPSAHVRVPYLTKLDLNLINKIFVLPGSSSSSFVVVVVVVVVVGGIGIGVARL